MSCYTSNVRRCAFLLGFVACFAWAQSPCEAKCNQLHSECLKRCAGDPKDAAKPEAAKRLMECLKTCDAEVRPCRESCK